MNRDFEFGIKKQLITKEELQKKVKELGVKITEDFKNENEPLIVIGLLKGSIVFMADLIREIKLPLEIDFIEASSYGEGTQSSREVKILSGNFISLIKSAINTIDPFNSPITINGSFSFLKSSVIFTPSSFTFF